jgi:hypothetical protein
MASILKIDELQGNTAVGNITVTGEGTATMRLSQGLCKSWVSLNGTSTIVIDDSFNMSSITDNSTGNYTTTYTNDLNSASYSAFAGGDINNSNDDVRRNNRLFRRTASIMKIVCGFNANSNTKEDWTDVQAGSFGDLA